jgi:DNA repair photolyase
MSDPIQPVAHKGRGAIGNRTGRYEGHEREGVDDGWWRDEAEPAPATTVAIDASRSVIAYNQSPDIGFDRAVNPYRGCEHGCIYCYARPSHAYLGLSPGLDFETKLLAKPDAPELLAAELSRKSYQCRPIALGSNTDPYQPVERRMAITRGVLETLDRFNHPLTIVTKSALVVRDLDILAHMAARNLARVSISITSLDRELARRMEPRASTPPRRLEAVARLAAAGVPTGVLVAPVIPALNDHEIEPILEAAAASGARDAGYVLLRLPLELKELFEGWLAEHAPGRAAHVLSLIRQMRGGKLNIAEFGERMRGAGPYAELIAQRFRIAARRLGLERRSLAPLDTTSFAPPPKAGDQLRLL